MRFIKVCVLLVLLPIASVAGTYNQQVMDAEMAALLLKSSREFVETSEGFGFLEKKTVHSVLRMWDQLDEMEDLVYLAKLKSLPDEWIPLLKDRYLAMGIITSFDDSDVYALSMMVCLVAHAFDDVMRGEMSFGAFQHISRFVTGTVGRRQAELIENKYFTGTKVLAPVEPLFPD